MLMMSERVAKTFSWTLRQGQVSGILVTKRRKSAIYRRSQETAPFIWEGLTRLGRHWRFICVETSPVLRLIATPPGCRFRMFVNGIFETERISLERKSG